MSICLFLIYLYRGEVVIQIKENYSWLDEKYKNNINCTTSTKYNYPNSLYYHQKQSTIAYELIYYLYFSEILLNILNKSKNIHKWMIKIIIEYCCGFMQFNDIFNNHIEKHLFINKHPFNLFCIMNENDDENEQWLESQWNYKKLNNNHKDDNEYKQKHLKLIFSYKLVQLLNQS